MCWQRSVLLIERNCLGSKSGAAVDLSLADRINEFITARRPESICDACISRALKVRDQQINQVTIALATTSDFDRNPGRCVDCGKEQKVTRKT